MAGRFQSSKSLRLACVRFCAGLRWGGFRCIASEEGAGLAETALALLVLLPALIGCLQISLAFNSYQDIGDAAREASRWASVRGSTSCTNTPNLTYCNATGTQIQSYVRGLGYPGLNSSGLSAATAWCAASTSSGSTSWATCSSSTAKAPGNLVQVTVTYAFPLTIAYWQVTTLNLSSTSSMVISQ